MRTVDPVKHEAKRQEVLKAARRCFMRDGFRSASISAICTEAGMSPGHLYHYFESKEAIMGAIIEMMLASATERFSQTMTSSDALAALIAEMQQTRMGKNGGRHTLFVDMLAEAGRNQELARILQVHSRGMQQLLADFLRNGQTQGRIDSSLDADTAAALLIGVVDGCKIMAIRGLPQDQNKVIELLQTLIKRFLTPPVTT
ncbi:TetR/AcrR family transcriptional regulator [Burkholderia sp. S171]|jgi:TetR/AcrR family transcriptional regulator, repressor for uid operon|uniref:TetR/AcrR family transcriptional regulator n=1 Tax=Burkholderia sp. S171 TaxID=1641860 RepID=UPI00131AF945|nr:TetR/AcrR family transcriptional regulator [Burkholderia sp. S171]